MLVTGLLLLVNTGFSKGLASIEFTPMGNVSMELGQIVSGYDKSTGDIEDVWMEKAFLGFGLQVLFSPADTLRGALEIKMFNEFPRKVNLGATRRLYHYPYIKEAQYIRSFIHNKNTSLAAGIGFFPYKYNDNVRNLGEHLFRSTTYPQTLTTEFDFPMARLFGCYVKNEVNFSFFSLPSTISTDFLVSSNMEWIAIHDLNGVLITRWNIGNIFEVGFGGGYWSILSVDKEATAPEKPSTSYIDSSGGTIDTLHYTFAGSKLMTMISFDPKRIFSKDGFGGIFSENDFKIYSEATMIGVKNYPASLESPIWYMSPLERIPITFGFNWPTHPLAAYTSVVAPVGLSYALEQNHSMGRSDKVKLLTYGGVGLLLGAGNWWLEKVAKKKLRLDVISIEAEWWGNRYPNNMEGIVIDGVPLPFREGVIEVDSTKYKGDNWKWSIYAKKTFAKHFEVTFQAACDHMRTFALEWSRQDWEESLRSPRRWYYVLKLGCAF